MSTAIEIAEGIASYRREQTILLRLMPFSDADFDKWFRNRESRQRPVPFHSVCGDAFLLGIGMNGFSEWAWWLDLLQHMMDLGGIDAKEKNGRIIYSKRWLNHVATP